MNKEYKSNTLFLWLDSESYFPQKIKKRGYHIGQVFKNTSTLSKILRRLVVMCNSTLISLWLGEWKNELSQKSTVIVHASILTPPVVKYLHRTHPHLRIIVWFWNPVSKDFPIDKFPKEICERWSFDTSDCEKYNLHYNSQYFFNDINTNNCAAEYDILFIGKDKGRGAELIKLKNSYESLGLKCFFYILGDTSLGDCYHQKYLPYDHVLSLINNSRCILDFVATNQVGLTLRPLESLFLQRKLITNDASIRELDFYSKENIFVVNNDDNVKLKSFVLDDYHIVQEDISDKYDFISWFNRLFV